MATNPIERALLHVNIGIVLASHGFIASVSLASAWLAEMPIALRVARNFELARTGVVCLLNTVTVLDVQPFVLVYELVKGRTFS